MRKLLFLGLLFTLLSTFSCNSGPTYVLITTSLGDIKVMLYDDTPEHRDNFLKLVEDEFYNGTLFHRVIPGFMIQGGDPTSKGAAPGTNLGNGGPGYTMEEEIGKPHIRGTLAAARSPDSSNPQRRSNGSQFFIVTGQRQTDQSLDRWQGMHNIQYNEAQRELYKTYGGRPDLDTQYTVFGEVVAGIEVADAITAVQRNSADRPVQDVSMTISVVSK
ncbi:MAG: peptidylprolyl isomerase [Bacteroidota bacterium]